MLRVTFDTNVYISGLNFKGKPFAIVESQIRGFAQVVEPKQTLDVMRDDPTDNRILECTVAGGSDYIVTGDNHLLKLGQFAGTSIVPPAAFLEIQFQQRGR